MTRVLVLMMLLGGARVRAETYYVCPCDNGAQSGCVAGDDSSATPTNAATPRNWVTQVFLNSRAPGDRVLICQGGSKVGAEISGILNTAVTPMAPLTIGTYVASWGGAGVKPWLRFGANSSGWIFGFGLGDGGANDGGYIIRGLKFDGAGDSNNVSACIQSYNSLWRAITVEDNEIVGCGNGLFFADVLAEGNISPNTFVKILRNHFHGNWETAAIHGSMNHYLIEGNTFIANGIPGGFAHHIYLGGYGVNGEVRNNTFSAAGNGRDESGTTCAGGNITFHGIQENLHIVANRIINASYTASNCAGIKVNTGYAPNRLEHFFNVVIEGNLIVNVGTGIGVAAAPGVRILNNTVVNSEVCINLPDTALEAGEPADANARILNNSCYVTAPTTAKVGINLGLAAGAGSGVIVRNNLIRFGTGSTSKTCFTHGAATLFSDFTRNSCSNEGGGTFVWSPSFNSLANAQAAGFDAHGQSDDPRLVATPSAETGWSMQVRPDSPARGAGTGCPRLSFTGRRVGSSCSLGAFQSVDP